MNPSSVLPASSLADIQSWVANLSLSVQEHLPVLEAVLRQWSTGALETTDALNKIKTMLPSESFKTLTKILSDAEAHITLAPAPAPPQFKSHGRILNGANNDKANNSSLSEVSDIFLPSSSSSSSSHLIGGRGGNDVLQDKSDQNVEDDHNKFMPARKRVKLNGKTWAPPAELPDTFAATATLMQAAMDEDSNSLDQYHSMTRLSDEENDDDDDDLHGAQSSGDDAIMLQQVVDFVKNANDHVYSATESSVEDVSDKEDLEDDFEDSDIAEANASGSGDEFVLHREVTEPFSPLTARQRKKKKSQAAAARKKKETPQKLPQRQSTRPRKVNRSKASAQQEDDDFDDGDSGPRGSAANSRRRPNLWTTQESEKLYKLRCDMPDADWKEISRKLGTGKTATQCSQRWTRVIDPEISRDPFSADEEELLLRLYDEMGKKWALIAKSLKKRRSDVACRMHIIRLKQAAGASWTKSDDEALAHWASSYSVGGTIDWNAVASEMRSSHTRFPLHCRQRYLFITNNKAR